MQNKEEKIDLTWVDDGRTLTEEERKELREYCEKNKNTTYHYPVRRGWMEG
ncbi:unnamed protein product [marine sediment metagenome]|uniref:Uncharacterized protein n=1 Tax=marine sediment metagenome TaxID=412755 RepID=X1RR67_9ZZZZ